MVEMELFRRYRWLIKGVVGTGKVDVRLPAHDDKVDSDQ